MLDVPALWEVPEPLEVLERLTSAVPGRSIWAVHDMLAARTWAVPALQDAEALEPALQAFRLPEASVEAADEAVQKPASFSLQREKE